MPRVETVQKARKSPGKCGKCGEEIPAGAPYRHWKFRFGGKHIRCMKSACGPRSSDLTGSDKLSRVYAAGESIEDALAAFDQDDDADSLRQAMEEAAEQVREVAEEYRESASNMESAFSGGSPQIDELNEKADNLESKADDIESAAGDLVGFEDWCRDEDVVDPDDDDAVAESLREEAEEDAAAAPGQEGEETSPGADADDEEKLEAHRAKLREAFDEKREEWREEQRSKVEEFTSIDVE